MISFGYILAFIFVIVVYLIICNWDDIINK